MPSNLWNSWGLFLRAHAKRNLSELHSPLYVSPWDFDDFGATSALLHGIITILLLGELRPGRRYALWLQTRLLCEVLCTRGGGVVLVGGAQLPQCVFKVLLNYMQIYIYICVCMLICLCFVFLGSTNKSFHARSGYRVPLGRLAPPAREFPSEPLNKWQALGSQCNCIGT